MLPHRCNTVFTVAAVCGERTVPSPEVCQLALQLRNAVTPRAGFARVAQR